MKYKLSKKAYYCGDAEALVDPKHPESTAKIVHVCITEQKPDIAARYAFFKERYNDGYKFCELKSRRCKDHDLYLIEGQEDIGERYLSEILNLIETEKWVQEMEEFIRINKDEKVFIWSGYHNSYWKPKGEGYIKDINHAGIFEIKDAWERVKHVDASKKIKFEIVN